jgi:hypothetical protein
MVNELFTIQQAAAIINCHPNTLRKWDKNGTLSPLRIGKRKDRRYTREQLDKMLNKHGNNNAIKSANEENFKIALKDNNIIFFTQDINLRYTWMYYSHPQFSPDLVIGKTEPEVLDTQTSKLTLPIKQRILKTGKPERCELNISTLGYKQVYDVRMQPLINSSGMVIGIAGVAIEVTGQKVLEEKIKKIEKKTKELEKEIVELKGVMTLDK